jgi:hypothetical protein
MGISLGLILTISTELGNGPNLESTGRARALNSLSTDTITRHQWPRTGPKEVIAKPVKNYLRYCEKVFCFTSGAINRIDWAFSVLLVKTNCIINWKRMPG